MPRICAFLYSVLFLCCGLSAHADKSLNELARDLDHTESIRAVKDLQHHYTQYAQFGLWSEIGSLFVADGSFVFDGLVAEATTSTGAEDIAAFLRSRYGGGIDGLKSDSLSAMFVDSPIVILSEDGESAKGRWQIMIFYGNGGEAHIEGGVFENQYVRKQGVWKFSKVSYYPQYDGPYNEGWVNWGGGELPVPPRHYTRDTIGVPIPSPGGVAPETSQSLLDLQTRVDVLNEKDRIRNLQSAYGFYADRKMWDDVVDLFANESVVEIEGQGIWKNKAGVKRWLNSIGAENLSHGQLNDRVQNSVIVTISPGGNEAFTRGIELGMLGEADQEFGWWEVATFRNRFVKEKGVWKIREMRRFPLMKTDIFLGWGKSRIEDPVPTGKQAPDSPMPQEGRIPFGLAMPAFLSANPVTGKTPAVAGDVKVAATKNLTPEISPANTVAVTLEEISQRLARSAAYDGIENVSAAYGYYIDDMDTLGWASMIATNGYKETPFSGYHIGRENIIKARVRGPAPTVQRGISYHWLMQPVVFVSDDGRSATGRFRLFQPRTGQTVGEAGDFFAAQFWGGMYHNRYVLEDGVWRIWELTLDEPYITPVAWKDGVWAKAKDPEETRVRGLGITDVDISLDDLGRREAILPGGAGESKEWPSILPMWFSYSNPVSGRIPEFYHPDCVGCELHPSLRLENNGYQEPPNSQEANRSPNH